MGERKPKQGQTVQAGFIPLLDCAPLVIAREKEAERIAADHVTAYKRDHDLGDPAEKRNLVKLETELTNISAKVNRAATLLDGM